MSVHLLLQDSTSILLQQFRPSDRNVEARYSYYARVGFPGDHNALHGHRYRADL